MCLSAEVSFAAAAVLIPAGAVAAVATLRAERRYFMIAALPFLFGLQQFVEGLIWTAGQAGDMDRVARYSYVYMYFTWIVWPVWAPLSAYFLERGARRIVILLFAVAGAMLGGLQFIPYFVHDGWLTTTFLSRAVRYDNISLLDGLVRREVTYAIYLTIVIAPFLLARQRDIKVFGLLVAAVLAITYLFFSYAYISVFCFGAAVVSAYLLAFIWRKQRPAAAAPFAA